MKHYIQGVLVCGVIIFTACDPLRVMDENVDLEEGVWLEDHKPDFEFEINDAKLKYNVYFNIRNTIGYKYHNLYITYYLLDEEGKQIASELEEIFLFHPKTGKPYGSGLGDIFEHQIPILENQPLEKPGRYTLIIEQYMRSPLSGVISIGARVEKNTLAE